MAFAYFMPDGSIETSGGNEVNSQLAMRAHMTIRNVGKDGNSAPYAEVTKMRGGPATLIVTADVPAIEEGKNAQAL